ncbi:MAG: ComEC/Rec2 family competence protein, partial [Patescibacteria group bacterium]
QFFYFHKVSLVSLLANILHLPIAPFLIIWGFIKSVIGLYFSPLGYLMGYISYLETNYMIFISTVLNNLPAAYFKLEVDSLFLAAIFYFLIIIFIIKNKDLIIDN